LAGATFKRADSLCAVPHFRATVDGLGMKEVDAILREARVGVVTAGEAGNATTAGIPADEPEVESVKVSVDATDEADARRKLEGALPEGTSIEILG